MVVGTRLAGPSFLGAGRTIRPPEGWTQTGWVTENPLWVLPKSRVRWTPPEAERLSLHWDLSMTPLPEEIMEPFVRLLDGWPGTVAKDLLKPLYPALIRMSLDSITTASLVTYEKSGRLLRVEYAFPEYSELGIVHYSPTEMYEFGEFQILAYEGKDPDFSRLLAVAEASMATFSVGQTEVVVQTGGEFEAGPVPAVSTAQAAEAASSEQGSLSSEWEASLDDWNLPEEGTELAPAAATAANSGALDFSPGAAETVQAASVPEPPAPAAEPAERSPAALAKQTEQSAARTEAAGADAPAVAKLRFRTHVLQPGETMKVLVKKRWPNLDDNAVMLKIREIYALNLSLGNAIEAWSLKAGVTIYLPEA